MRQLLPPHFARTWPSGLRTVKHRPGHPPQPLCQAAASAKHQPMEDAGARTTRLLLATRFVRSVGQGALAVDFTLYLRALHWSAVAISGVLSGALLVGVVLTLVAGPLSDRGAGAASCSSMRPLNAWPDLPPCCRGRQRWSGPPRWSEASVEAATVPRVPSPQWNRPGWRNRSAPRAEARCTALNAALGFLGNAVGAVIAAAPARLATILPGALAFRPLFLLSAVGSLLCCALILRTPDSEAAAAHDAPRARTRFAARSIGRRTGWCCGS